MADIVRESISEKLTLEQIKQAEQLAEGWLIQNSLAE
jgi:hypothetical protein